MTDTKELKAFMVRSGISQGKLAELLNISEATLSYKVNNKRMFDAFEIQQIKRFLNLTSEERDRIFFGE